MDEARRARRAPKGLRHLRKARVLALLGNDVVVQACWLAAGVSTSERTIYRYITALRRDGHLILSDAGVGYQLRHRRQPTTDTGARECR